MTCRPGHSPRHENFGAGNQANHKHGAFSERAVGPLAEEIEADLIAHAPWCSRDGFAPGRRRYARAEAVATLLWAYVAEHGPLDDDGNPRPALDALFKWEASAANRGAALALDPTSFAKLLASFTVGQPAGGDDVLAALRAEGARLVAAHDAGPALPEVTR
jgi:hypothetical protein